MNTKDVVSIVVPVYNVEKYLNRCLDSLIEQSYRYLEIILIDDGSPDNCYDICDHYCKKDKRVKVIHKKNEGVSAARNDGIKKSSGKYICFVDSDDWLPRTAIEDLLTAIEEKEVDFIYGSAKVLAPIRNYSLSAPNCVIRKCDFEKWMNYVSTVYTSPWGKLFKRKIIIENSIEYPLNVKRAQDTIFVLRYLQHCTCVAGITKEVYIYNAFNEESVTGKYYDNYNQWLAACVCEFCKLLEEIDDKEKGQFILRYSERYLGMMCGLYVKSMRGSREEVCGKIFESYNLVLQFIHEYLVYLNDKNDKEKLWIISIMNNGEVEKVFEKLSIANKKNNTILKIALRKIVGTIKEKYYCCKT